MEDENDQLVPLNGTYVTFGEVLNYKLKKECKRFKVYLNHLNKTILSKNLKNEKNQIIEE